MTQTNLKFEQHRADFDYCQTITKQSSNAFYTAFSKLPQTRAWSIYAVYAFCRTADDLVDVHHDIAGLAALRQSLTDFAAGRVPDHPMWRALAIVFETYDMNIDAFFDMLSGQEQDATFTQPTTQRELERYCYYVAGSVGLMILPMLATDHQTITQPAIQLGIAMQLTNILRDVGEDYQHGRIYLPTECLHHYQLQPADLAARTPSAHFIALWEHEAQIAMSNYEAALTMLPTIDTVAQPSLLAATALYRELLVVAREQQYPVLTQRVFLTAGRKTQVLHQVASTIHTLTAH